MTAEEYLRAGQLDEALKELQGSIRAKPADAKLRIFLFQLQCISGAWQKALTQLNVLSEMDLESAMLAKIFTPVLNLEALRADVFAGKRSPLIFGEPPEWIGKLLQSNQLVAQGNYDAAAELRDQAFEAAPTFPGTINGQPFEWLADADSRLGPVLEVFLDGKYYWIPFSRIKAIIVEPPTDLRDMVWMSAQFIWSNGGKGSGFIPTRYSGTESNPDSALRLSRKTEWKEPAEGTYIGLGQRLFASDQSEVSLLDTRKIEFAECEEAPAAPTPAAESSEVEEPAAETPS
jgi:type VI secretion system protein ImpE